jgi:integrase
LAVFGLSQDVKMDAAKAHAILAPYNVSLWDAASYYKKHVLAYKSAPTVRDIIEKMIAEKKLKNRSDATVRDLKSRLENTFAEDFGDRRLHEITKEEVEEWLNDEEWTPRSRINYHTKISQLYNYARKNQWADENVTKRIDRPSAVDSDPEIFTVEQAEMLLQKADDFGLLPYVALGLFAGLRSTELMKLKGEWILAEEKSIIVPAEIAKKRSRRVVKMEDALLAWLQPCLPLRGNIVSASEFRSNMDLLRAAAGIEKWPKNGLRHSFASYHLAAFENEIQTAKEMGHRDSNIVHKNYKQLILKSQATKFWALRPPTPAVPAETSSVSIAA